MSATCEAPDCLRPTRGGRTFCDAHQRRVNRGTSVTAPLVEARTPWERFVDAVHRYADADTGDDAEFERAMWNLRDAGRRYFARGLSGPPPVIDTAKAVRLFRETKSVRKVAKELGFSRDAVRRALSRGGVRRAGGVTPTGVARPPKGQG